MRLDEIGIVDKARGMMDRRRAKKAVKVEIKRVLKQMNTWIGLMTPDDIAELTTQDLENFFQNVNYGQSGAQLLKKIKSQVAQRDQDEQEPEPKTKSEPEWQESPLVDPAELDPKQTAQGRQKARSKPSSQQQDSLGTDDVFTVEMVLEARARPKDPVVAYVLKHARQVVQNVISKAAQQNTQGVIQQAERFSQGGSGSGGSSSSRSSSQESRPSLTDDQERALEKAWRDLISKADQDVLKPSEKMDIRDFLISLGVDIR